MADYAITGSGGGVGGGSATIAFLKTYSVTGSGGGVVGGAATFTFTQRKAVTGTGGGVGGGSATIKIGKVVLGAGGGIGGGSATITISAVAVPANLDAIVLNAENLARSHYANFAFDSLISFKGSIYGTLGGVLYQHTGTTDAGTAIATTVRTGQNDFGVTEKKNIPDVYVNAESAGVFTAKSVTDNAAESSAISIAAISGVSGIAPRRAKMPLGRMSRMWGVEVANVSGAANEIDSIEMIPDGGSRRV